MSTLIASEKTLDELRDAPRAMIVLNDTGDTRYMWDPDNEAETAAARETFRSLTAKGHVAYRTDKNGGQGERMREFDPRAERMILHPQMRGG